MESVKKMNQSYNELIYLTNYDILKRFLSSCFKSL
jgi:hypothetical protein